LAVPVPVDYFYVRLRQIRCGFLIGKLRWAGSGSALLLLSLLIALLFNFTSTGTGTAKKKLVLRWVRIPFTVLFSFYCLGSAVAVFLGRVTGTGTGTEKTGWLSPAGSGSQLISHAEGLANLFYLLGSDIFCFKKRAMSTGTGTPSNKRFLSTRL
jgi:hypothetical protein